MSGVFATAALMGFSVWAHPGVASKHWKKVSRTKRRRLRRTYWYARITGNKELPDSGIECTAKSKKMCSPFLEETLIIKKDSNKQETPIMPELPEVEVTRQGITPHIQQQILTAFIARRSNLRWPRV